MSLSATLAVTPGTDVVRFAYEVRNEADDPVTLTFTSGRTADVAVSADGTEVWRWSEGRLFTQAIETRTLGPGEAFTTEVSWEDPSPGSYTAEATLSAQDQEAPATAAFEVA